MARVVLEPIEPLDRGGDPLLERVSRCQAHGRAVERLEFVCGSVALQRSKRFAGRDHGFVADLVQAEQAFAVELRPSRAERLESRQVKGGVVEPRIVSRDERRELGGLSPKKGPERPERQGPASRFDVAGLGRFEQCPHPIDPAGDKLGLDLANEKVRDPGRDGVDDHLGVVSADHIVLQPGDARLDEGEERRRLKEPQPVRQSVVPQVRSPPRAEHAPSP